MKREEQTRIMYEKIVNSAICEFNEHNYESASMNHICEIGGLSKGIIYHYFKDKDELYLECIRKCYATLADYYNQNTHEVDDIQNYMQVRMSFFKEHPEFRNLFFYTLLQTPMKLEKEVNELKSYLTAINSAFYKKFLEGLCLRDGIDIEKAIRYVDIIQTLFNDHFRKEAQSGNNFEAVVTKHEELIPEWIDLILHGIAKEG